MRKFTLDEQEVFIASMSQNREKHGEKNIRGMTIGVKTQVHPRVIDPLVHGLSESFEKILFSGQGDDIHKNSGLQVLRFDTEFRNYIVIFNYHMLDDDNSQAKRFTQAKITEFMAEPIEGGLVDISFSIYLNPDDQASNWLNEGFMHEMWKLEVVGPMQTGMLDDTDQNDDSEDHDDGVPEDIQEEDAA